jgi:hypothetical protein
VLRTDKAKQATKEVLATHCISSDRSPDLEAGAAAANGGPPGGGGGGGGGAAANGGSAAGGGKRKGRG